MTTNTVPFELKGSMYTVLVMRLFVSDVSVITEQIHSKRNEGGALLKGALLVLDFMELSDHENLQLAPLVKILRAAGLIPIGVRNVSDRLLSQAESINLPLLPDVKPANRKPAVVDNMTESEEQHKKNLDTISQDQIKNRSIVPANRLVMTPIRSGQQIYAHGDLTLCSKVSAGAEILADGNIHVYGTLRGKALAGVSGDRNARIFCLDLKAELVSIAGSYLMIEQLRPELRDRPVQIYLQDDKLHIVPITNGI